MAEKTPAQAKAVKRLRDWALTGEGRALLQLDAPGAFARCQTFYKGKVPGHMVDGWCAELIHDATGQWPGQHGRGNG
ncbi:hypothetical protein JNW90_10705 [Micromonospora sp. STR1s_5]|nr:hypothetical protein [Micromonospora sp. STR1s_5]